jgi:hypothetical protein
LKRPDKDTPLYARRFFFFETFLGRSGPRSMRTIGMMTIVHGMLLTPPKRTRWLGNFTIFFSALLIDGASASDQGL